MLLCSLKGFKQAEKQIMALLIFFKQTSQRFSKMLSFD